MEAGHYVMLSLHVCIDRSPSFFLDPTMYIVVVGDWQIDIYMHWIDQTREFICMFTRLYVWAQ